MRTPFRLIIPLLLVPVVLMGCGNDDSASTTTVARSSSDRSTSSDAGSKNTDSRAEKIGQEVANSDSLDTVDSKMQSCVGQAFIDAFGDNAEQVATTAHKTSADLTAEQTTAVANAFDTCIPGSAFASYYMSTLYDQAQLGDPDQTAVDCLAKRIDGTVGQIVAAFNASSPEPPADFLAALDECVPQEAVAGLIAAGLQKAGAGGNPLSKAQADCVVAAVAPKVKFSQISNGDTQELQALIQQSIAACPA